MALLRLLTSILLFIGATYSRSLEINDDVDMGHASREVVSNSSDVPPVDACAHVNSTMERLTTDSVYAGCSACVTRGNCLFKEELGSTIIYTCSQTYPVPSSRTYTTTLNECAHRYEKEAWEVAYHISRFGLGETVAVQCTSEGVETALVDLPASVPKEIITRRNVETAVRLLKLSYKEGLLYAIKGTENMEKFWQDAQKSGLYWRRLQKEKWEKVHRAAYLYKALSITFGSISAIICVVVALLFCKLYFMHKEERNQGVSN